MQAPQINMLVFLLEVTGQIGQYFKILISHGNMTTLIAFAPYRRNLVFLEDNELAHILEKNEYQIRKMLHNKRRSTYHVGFKIKFAIRDNKQVQLFNDPEKIIVLDRRNGRYLSYVKDTGDPQALEIYTDGCYIHNTHQGGYVALIKKNNGKYDLAWGHTDNPSNSTLLELMGAIKGLEHLPPNIEKIRIITDSRYVIKGLTEWVVNWRLNDWYTIQGRKVRNIEYWEKFDELTKGKYIEFQWIKAHSFHFENTLCDKYAKQAAAYNKLNQKTQKNAGNYSAIN
jgi:ribonuclease HI